LNGTAPEGCSDAASDAARDAGSLVYDERLSGDLDALTDFADELSRLDTRRGGLDAAIPDRINANAENIEQGLAKLVLTLIQLIIRLLERQAMRRMDAGSLTEDEIERLGETFLKLDRKMAEMKEVFGLTDEDLNLNLGPLGDLM